MELRQTDVIITLCVCMLLGMCVGRYVDVWFLAGLLALLMHLSVRRKSWKIAMAVILAAFSLGNWRAVRQNDGFELLRAHFETKTTLRATSLDDAEYDSRGQLAFNADHIEIDGRRIPGQIAISGFGEFSVLRGDTVEVVGKLFEARGSNQARISFAQLNTVQKDQSWYNTMRRLFIKKLRDNLPEPLSSFAAGLLIGQRSTIPDQIITDLRVTGLAHIIAVSGYNLTILVRAVVRLLKKASRYQKLMVSMLLIGWFLLITGFSASIVRAAIVSVLSLLAWYSGRILRPAVLLGVSAAATGLYKPEYVWGDVGWYLSFLAFSGVMIVAPLLRQRFAVGKSLKMFGSMLIETVAVLLMVTPYSLYIFGTLSFFALPANLLIVPFVPLAMLLSAISGVLPYQLSLLATPATLLLDGMLSAVHVLASLPLASMSTKLSIVDMWVIYLMLMGVLLLIWHSIKRRQKIQNLLQ